MAGKLLRYDTSDDTWELVNVDFEVWWVEAGWVVCDLLQGSTAGKAIKSFVARDRPLTKLGRVQS